MKTITLDTLLQRNGIPVDKFDVLNMDIQGAELKALEGVYYTIETNNPFQYLSL
jgi:FkbM family methyltransferase